MMIAVSQTTHQVDLVDDMDSLMAEHREDSQYRQALQENIPQRAFPLKS